MEGEVVHITFKQFVESTYFKGLARACMVVAVPALISVGGLLLSLMGDVAGVKTTQEARAADNDRFQTAIISDVGDVKVDVADVKEGVGAVQGEVNGVKVELAKLTGILQEMQRRDLAQYNMRPLQ